MSFGKRLKKHCAFNDLMKMRVFSKTCLIALAVLAVAGAPGRALGWGAMHGAITQAALSVLPEWQQELLASERRGLIDQYCMIPDLAQAPAHKQEFAPFVVLPNGDLFCHLPMKTRPENAYQMKHYLDQVVLTVRANQMSEAARWMGCLLHFLEDSGSPAHAMPGDNQMGLMKDLLPTPEAFKPQPAHSLIEEGRLLVRVSGYRPRLLGTTTEEALLHLMERYDAMVRNARAQIIPILQGTYKGAQAEIDAGQLRAATMDARVAADAIYTLLSIAKGRFEADDLAALDAVDVSGLTPLEVIHQSYYPQHLYFSDPYFGFPVRNGILDANSGKQKRPLVLKMNGQSGVAEKEFSEGVGLGTGFRMTYALPAKVYDQFECMVGLHAALGGQGKMAFKVYADEALVFDSGEMTGESAAKAVRVPLWGVKTLVIATEGRGGARGNNYAVIAEPRLLKTKDPAKLAALKGTVIAEPLPLTRTPGAPPVKRKTE